MEEDDDETCDAVIFNSISEVVSSPSDDDNYILPPHQRCASHTLSLICTTDLKSVTSRTHRSAFAKCYGIWNRIGRSTACSENVAEICSRCIIRPSATRWNSVYHSVVDMLKMETKLDAISDATEVSRIKSARLCS